MTIISRHQIPCIKKAEPCRHKENNFRPLRKKIDLFAILESGILFKDLFHMLIVCLYALKMGGPDIIKKLAKVLFKRSERIGVYRSYDSIKNLDDKNLIRKS